MPKNNPIKSAIILASIPIDNDNLDPTKTLSNISLPKWSVPNKFPLLPIGNKVLFKFCIFSVLINKKVLFSEIE